MGVDGLEGVVLVVGSSLDFSLINLQRYSLELVLYFSYHPLKLI